MSLSAIVMTEGAHVVNELFMPAPLFGGIALCVFAVLGIVTWSFRDVANRHAEKAEAYAREHGGQQH